VRSADRSWLILREVHQGLDIFKIPGSTCGPLHIDEVFTRYNDGLHLLKWNPQSPLVYGIKVKRLLNKKIQGKPRMIRMPEREDGHVFLAAPGFASLRIGKGSKGHRHPWLKSETLENGQRSFQIVGFQLDDEVEIESRAEISMQNDGNSTDHEISDIGPFQRLKNPFDTSSHGDSVPRRLAVCLLQAESGSHLPASLLFC
jgi:hypothetical protein